jgi:hypothetical protein
MAVLPVPTRNTLLAMVMFVLFDEIEIPVGALMKVKFFIRTLDTPLMVMVAPVLLPVMKVLAVSLPMIGTLLMGVMGPAYGVASAITRMRKLLVVPDVIRLLAAAMAD